ncbi:MAG: hypothetical protein IPL55_19500 [Saprospiraceae bacterium]|jgi:hypothetical protein|nr:hypothetical protein [Saprospiraceae bacterium]MBL0026844.1 hypothetical protein [Saprospiraceae bacterium]
MNSTVTNVELLYEKAKTYTEPSIELAKLNAIDKTADLVSSLVSRSIAVMVMAMFTIFINIALSLYLGHLFGKNYLGFVAVSGLYLIAYFIIVHWSDSIIKIPITNLVIAKLLKSKSHDSN